MPWTGFCNYSRDLHPGNQQNDRWFRREGSKEMKRQDVRIGEDFEEEDVKQETVSECRWTVPCKIDQTGFDVKFETSEVRNEGLA